MNSRFPIVFLAASLSAFAQTNTPNLTNAQVKAATPKTSSCKFSSPRTRHTSASPIGVRQSSIVGSGFARAVGRRRESYAWSSRRPSQATGEQQNSKSQMANGRWDEKEQDHRTDRTNGTAFGGRDRETGSFNRRDAGDAEER